MKKSTLLYHLIVALAVVSGPMIVDAVPGDLYVTDGLNPGSIFQFTPDGTRSTFATGLNGPFGLAFDAAVNPIDLFESDNAGGIIYKFTLDGTRSTFSSLANVTGLAVDASGNVYAADNSFGNIYRYTPDGTRSTFATGTGHPFGLTFDSSGNLFVAQGLTGGTIVKITPDGTMSTFATGLNAPWGLAFDVSGNLFVTENFGGTILRFTPEGNRTTFASGLASPQGLAFDSSGYLFAAEYPSGSIFKYAPDGTRTTFATGLSGPYSLAFETGPTPTPTPTPTPGQIELRANAQRVGPHRKVVELRWIGANSPRVDIFRNGVRIARVPTNPGMYTDVLFSPGLYTYKVCEAGSMNCSNEVTVRGP